MKQFAFLLITLFSSIVIFAQSNDLVNREPYTLKLAVDSANFYESEVKSSPYVLPDNSIQIYTGEKMYIEVELNKKEIKSIKTVKENLNPEKTLVISLEQKATERNHELMMLKIENPFKYKLEYKAFMFLMAYNKWVPTNVIPVGAKLSSYETWPDIIVTMSLSEWKFK